jgi:hypothetical protein
MGGSKAKKRKLQPLWVTVSLSIGLIVAVSTYFIYLPMVNQMKTYAKNLPSVITDVLPVESWAIVPFMVSITYFCLTSFVTYLVFAFVKYLRGRYGKPNPT